MPTRSFQFWFQNDKRRRCCHSFQGLCHRYLLYKQFLPKTHHLMCPVLMFFLDTFEALLFLESLQNFYLPYHLSSRTHFFLFFLTDILCCCTVCSIISSNEVGVSIAFTISSLIMLRQYYPVQATLCRYLRDSVSAISIYVVL